MRFIPDIVRDRFFLSSKRLDELVKQKFKEGAQTGVDSDEDLYRPLTQDTSRDLNPIKYGRHLELCYKLWLQNPLAKKLIQHMKNFCVGGGVKVISEGEEIQKIIDRFWNDPYNKMDLKLPGMVEALGIFGEQCYPFTRFEDGSVRIGYVDPKNISEVKLDPKTFTEPSEINIPTAEKPQNWKKIITIDEDPESETFGKLIGDVFYFQINRVPNTFRGYSDLLAHADWIDGYDQFLYSMIDRSILMNAFIWDITVTGADEKELRKIEITHKNPKPGSSRFHNDKMKWEAVSPDLKSGDVSELFKVFRTQIIGSAGFPLHWFGDGSDANLATAEEMGAPTMKMLEERQRFIKYMIDQMITYVIQEGRGTDSQRVKNKGKDEETEKLFEVQFPELSRKDITKTSAAFVQVVNALTTAKSQGLLSNETGMKILANSAALLGVEIDPEEELQKVKDTKQEEDGKDYYDKEKQDQEKELLTKLRKEGKPNERED